MEHANPLGEERIVKLLARFSIPAIVGMMVNALYNIVDRIFIGNSDYLGTNGLAAATVCFPIMIIVLAVGLLFGIGGATLFSIKLGEGKKEEAERVLGNAFVLLVLGGIVVSILGLAFMRKLLIYFGASDATLPYAEEYMSVIFFGSVFQVVSIGLNHFIRADGSPKIAMLTMFFGAGLNTVLDPLFIYVFRMGMAGAALATILSQMASASWVTLYFLGRKCKNRLRVRNMHLKLKILYTIVILGMPNFLLQVANSFLNITLNKTIYTYGGNIAVSGMGVVNSIQTLLLMPIIGLNQGVQPIVSYNFGAKKYDRVKSAAKSAIFAATTVVMIGFVITRLFPVQLVSMFNRDEELLAFGKHAVKAWFMLLPVVGFQIIGSSFFQAIGRAKSAMFLTLTRQVILLLPAIIVFARLFGLKGILYAAPFADFFSFVLTFIWFGFGIRSLTKLQNQAQNIHLK